MDFIKKIAPGGYLYFASAITGIIGLVIMIISGTMSSANKINSMGLMTVFAIIAIVLPIASIYLNTAKMDFIGTVTSMISAALYTIVVGNLISSRILLISGLFSWNSMDNVGWSVFYVSIASIIFFILSILLLTVGNFAKTVKDK